MLTGDLEKAITTYLKAEKLAPEDVVILSNLAEAYNRNGQKEKALEYYQKVLQYGDNNLKEQAQQRINELRK